MLLFPKNKMLSILMKPMQPKDLLIILLSLVLAYMLYNKTKATECKKCDQAKEGDNKKDIQMFGRDTCPYCVKMKKQLKEDGQWSRIDYKDVEKSEEAKLAFKKEDASGVPFFKSEHATSSGSQTTKSLLENLGLN
jgi:thioredoxin-related protein